MSFGIVVGHSAEPAAPDDLPLADGPAQADLETLRLYECPDWFRDAKFGIRVHWGPENIPELGPDYAANYRIPGRRQYEYHVEHFGNPDSVGYEALVERWKGEKFDPAALMEQFVNAGAKYFVTLAVDSAGYRLSSMQPEEKDEPFKGVRDIIAEWLNVARKRDLRFGVSVQALSTPDGREHGSGDAFKWFEEAHELVDKYRPDLFYALGTPAEEQAEFAVMAHFYNRTIEWNNDLIGVYAARAVSQPHIVETGVETIERGSKSEIAPRPWQCDTPLNDWVYDRAQPVRPAGGLVHLLVDVVSKNGNLLLNVPLRGDGSLPVEAGPVLDEIGVWLAANGEAIYGTRPWRIFGEGPTETVGGPLGENKTLPYTPEDIRYTFKSWVDSDGEQRECVYAILLGQPGAGDEVVLGALAAGAKARPIGTVRLLGYDGALRILRDRDGLHILMPPDVSSQPAIVFRID